MPAYRKNTQQEAASQGQESVIDVTPSSVEYKDQQSQPRGDYTSPELPENIFDKAKPIKNGGHKTLVFLLAGVAVVVISQLYQQQSQGIVTGVEAAESKSIFANVKGAKIGDVFTIKKTTAVRMEENAAALRRTENHMVSAFATRDALRKIETESYAKKYLGAYEKNMSAEEVRQVMMRAGYYMPKQVAAAPQENVEISQESRPLEAKDDIRFAKGVAKDYVREEIEDFVDKVNLLGRVVKYVTKRVEE